MKNSELFGMSGSIRFLLVEDSTVDIIDLSQTNLVTCKKFSQSVAVLCHRLRGDRRLKVSADVLKERDANLPIVVVRAVGNAVWRSGMVVDGLRPPLCNGMRPTRDGPCRADLRQAGAVKGNEAQGRGDLHFRERTGLQKRHGDKACANAAQAGFREGALKRRRKIADPI